MKITFAILFFTAIVFLGCRGASTDPTPIVIPTSSMIGMNLGTFSQGGDGLVFEHTLEYFELARYEVTYELWYAVAAWASTHGYAFESRGSEGSSDITGTVPTASGKYHPVTNVSWRDALIWCNAYSEATGLVPVYRTPDDAVIRDSRDANGTVCDSAVIHDDADGYRLPTEGQWQFAATDRGVNDWSYAAGGNVPWNSLDDDNSNGFPDGKDVNDAVAVYFWYRDTDMYMQTGVVSTASVGSKIANTTGFADMSGNISEHCWDWRADYPDTSGSDYQGPASGTRRIMRGGSWYSYAESLQTGFREDMDPASGAFWLGFRVARIP